MAIQGNSWQEMTTEGTSALNTLAQAAAEAHPAPSVRNIEGTMQHVGANVPAPENEVTCVSVASPHAAESSVSQTLPPSALHAATDPA